MPVTISIFIDHYLENWLSIRLHYLKLTSFGHIRTFQPFIIEFQAICIQDHAKWRHKDVTWPKMTVKLAEKLKIAIRTHFLEFYYRSSNKNFNFFNFFFTLHNILRRILSTALSTFQFWRVQFISTRKAGDIATATRPATGLSRKKWLKWTSFITFMYS